MMRWFGAPARSELVSEPSRCANRRGIERDTKTRKKVKFFDEKRVCGESSGAAS